MSPLTPPRSYVYWLLTGCALIYLMVLIGCLTRLTRSGLSITDWSVMGTLPPLSEQSWQEHFLRYQDSPEYRLINSGMSLEDFKGIFWWEWIHRLLGRLIGFVFLGGFCYFLARRALNLRLVLQTLLLLVIGGAQGLIGWWMVKSGLVKDPHVSHFRLAIHLLTAFAAFAWAFWLALKQLVAPPSNTDDSLSFAHRRLLRLFTAIGLALLILQIAYGAFVAGLKAGYYYPSWPKMGDSWFPAEAILLDNSLIRSFLENPAGVQFVHRTLALVVLATFAAPWLLSWAKAPRARETHALGFVIGLLFLQIVLGIFTLLYHVPIILAALHQSVAFFVFGAALYAYFLLSSNSQRFRCARDESSALNAANLGAESAL